MVWWVEYLNSVLVIGLNNMMCWVLFMEIIVFMDEWMMLVSWVLFFLRYDRFWVMVVCSFWSCS